MEEMRNRPPQESSMTLTLAHDTAVVMGAAAIHYRAILSTGSENAATIALCDQMYQCIMQHPQLSLVTREMLRDMRLIVAGQKDAYEGETAYATTRHAQSGD